MTCSTARRAGRPQGVLPAHRARADLGDAPAPARPGLSLVPRPQRQGLRAVRAGRGQALQRQLHHHRRQRDPDAAAARQRLGHLERAEHRRLDDAAVDHGARPRRCDLRRHLSRDGRRGVERAGPDRPPPRHDPDRRDRRLRGQPQGLRRQHGPARLPARASTAWAPTTGRSRARRHRDRLPELGRAGGLRQGPPGAVRRPGLGPSPLRLPDPPNFLRPDPNSATLSSLSRIESALDRAQRAYGGRGGMPIDITEWGVQSRGPSPYSALQPGPAGRVPQRGRVHGVEEPAGARFSQFLLVDAAPNTKYKKGTKPYWATFQSGLLFYPGRSPSRPTTPSSCRSGSPSPSTAPTSSSGLRSVPPTPRKGRSCSSSPREPNTWTTWPPSARPTPRASSPPTSPALRRGRAAGLDRRPAASRSTAAPPRSPERGERVAARAAGGGGPAVTVSVGAGHEANVNGGLGKGGWSVAGEILNAQIAHRRSRRRAISRFSPLNSQIAHCARRGCAI